MQFAPRERHVRAVQLNSENNILEISAIVNDKNEKMKDQICEMLTRPKRDWSLLPVDMKHVDEVRSVLSRRRANYGLRGQLG
jgi:hypothetical protein